MQVLVLHRYFWPQPYPYAQMLKDIVETLSTHHSVSILTTDSGSSTEKNQRSVWSDKQNIKIDTLSLSSEKRASMIKKALNSLYFGFWLIYKLTLTRADAVMVATTPPVVVAMIVRWVSYFKKFKYVYHCQDIHPEAMLLGGNIQEGFIYKLLRNIDKKNINGAWKVITLSNDMKKTLEKRGCKVSHVNIINNFIFKSSDSTPTPCKNKHDKIQFLFAGSLGRLQNLRLLMDSLVLLKSRTELHFTFMGDGVMFEEMNQCKNDNKLTNVTFLGQRNIEEAVSAMQSADVGIVSIGPKIANVAYPSKTMMYLGNGLPILALVEKDTEIYRYINKYQVGIAVMPTSAKDISNAILKLSRTLTNSPISKADIKNTAESTFGKAIILPKFLEIFYE